jgi:lactose/cellobiose-specific phosphotransferase system IIC component
LHSLSNHRWFKAIRHSLVLLLPVVFVGAVALLLGSFPFAILLPQMDSALVQRSGELAVLVSNASNGILSLCLVVLISHRLAVEFRANRDAEISPPLVAIVALVNFFVFIQLSSPTSSDLRTLGAHGVLPAIVVAIITAELLFVLLRARVLQVGRASYDLVDPTLHLAVRSIIPVIVTVTVFLLATKALLMLPLALAQWAGTGLLALNSGLGSQLPGLLVLGALNQLLWFVGIHGPNVLMESVYPIMFPATGDSRQIFDVTKTFFDLYVHIGGSGSTLGLLLAILIYDRRGEARRVAKYALVPSLFNINELVIFGLPIAFNPVYLIPFLVAPLLQIALTYLCVRHGLVAIDVTLVPWTTPPLLAGALNSGSWRGGALQCFSIVMSALVYAPFVRADVRQRKAASIRQGQRIVADIESVHARDGRVLDRPDEVGHVARKLVHDLLRDLGTERVYLAYQPQHDANGRIVAVEALVRWEHGDYGPIAPDIVCALLEEANQIHPLGSWVIEAACAQLRDWDLAGIGDLRMAVNLSPLQLRDATLVPLLEACLRANDLAARRLTLELTESQQVPEDEVSVKTLGDLHAMGVNLEVDDFGMGYASMLYIRRFHFDAIKLDGSLTKDVLLDNHCSDIIASVVQLARALEIRVVAEFVETREQQLLLERLGCDIFQGFLYSAPLSGPQCLAYLRRASTLPVPEQLCISGLPVGVISH